MRYKQVSISDMSAKFIMHLSPRDLTFRLPLLRLQPLPGTSDAVVSQQCGGPFPLLVVDERQLNPSLGGPVPARDLDRQDVGLVEEEGCIPCGMRHAPSQRAIACQRRDFKFIGSTGSQHEIN